MPLSSDPTKRAAQLANLRRGGPPAGAGNGLAVSHGGYARIVAARVDAKVREVFDALATDAPLRADGGELPAADTVAVRLLAEALCRLDDVVVNITQYGAFNQRTKAPRPVLDLERMLRGEVLKYLDALGMTPTSRAKLGLDVARTFDLAAQLAALNGDGGGVDGG